MRHAEPSPERPYLRSLSYRFPSVASALAEIAHLRAVLALPVGTTHVVSDVHGEDKKLAHILRNASGSLRPLVARVFEGRLDEDEARTLLSLIYYPKETFALVVGREASDAARHAFVRTAVSREFELMRALAARYTLRHAERIFPPEYRTLFRELLFSPPLGRQPRYLEALLAPFLAEDGGVELLRAVSRTLRAFSVFELVVGGDLGDRGPRIDKVIEVLRQQRNMSITWGNHDAAWMGACLGQPALVATVLRVSLRYARLAQLEEGYGIPVEAIEQLAHVEYGDDPAERFRAKGEDLRDPLLLARMQKAMAILQFKLEAQCARRNPHFGLEDRALLHRIDPQAGTVAIGGATYPLLDTRFPTIDWRDPYALSPAEERCLEHMTRAFYASATLWRDMRFVADKGGMYINHDDALIFHGCVPTGDQGEFLAVDVDGTARSGRELFDALDGSVRRAFHTCATRDVDLLYYLWAGPRSPLFGKDKMATFETYFVADKALHHESKNPYFKLIHERDFCRRVLVELGADPDRALIVNGHVPVKLEQGESPLKRSGIAVTIDGAFSEAYGDKGYTLVLEADRTYLARHHHFDSVQAAVERGSDIVPDVEELRRYDEPRTVGDSRRGAELREEIAGLERLVAAYRAREIDPPRE